MSKLPRASLSRMAQYKGPRNSLEIGLAQQELERVLNSFEYNTLLPAEKDSIIEHLTLEYYYFKYSETNDRKDTAYYHWQIQSIARKLKQDIIRYPAIKRHILYDPALLDLMADDNTEPEYAPTTGQERSTFNTNRDAYTHYWPEYYSDKNTTNTKVEDNKPIKSIVPPPESYYKNNHTTNTSGARTMTGNEYIRDLNRRKWLHLRSMLIACWDIAGTPTYARFEREIDTRFHRDNNTIVNYMVDNFDAATINQAHERAKSMYGGRGRPKFSRNIETVRSAAGNTSTHDSSNDTALDAILDSTSDNASTSNDNANSAAATAANVNLDAYVLKTQHKRDMDRITSDMGYMGSDIITLTTRINHLEESRINTIVITPKEPDLPKIELGAQHFNFPTLLAMCMARTPDASHLNVWLYGPAGTGKTTAAKNVAKALGLKFYSMGALETGYQILGYTGADGRTYKRTHFRDCWEHGGVIALDECDSYTPSAALALNGALANGYCAFDDQLIERHKDCIIIAGANTTGLGGTMEYVGRMKHDAAFLDRFVMLDWPIDEALEAHLCDHAQWLQRVRSVRANIIAKQIKGAMVTPRATIYGAALLRAGLSWDIVERTTLKKGMTDAQWQQVAG